ncbi:hypothetical protein C8R43DRAFT_586822 [Mycena crocata]|nr:hypothetical protein C8R43DRAFT_586822 [Mycena crocata]
MHRYPSDFLTHQRSVLKVAGLGAVDRYPTSTSIVPSEIRHLIINGGWNIWGKESLDEALSLLPILPGLEVLRLHYMNWDNVSGSSRTILTSAFSNVVQLELSRFGTNRLRELVEILTSFPRLESLSLDEVDETVGSGRLITGLGSPPPFQCLQSLHISLSYSADFLSWFLTIEPLPPISRLSLGDIADSFQSEDGDEPWQDRGILRREEDALVNCQKAFAANLQHVIYRCHMGSYVHPNGLHFPRLRILEGNIWGVNSSTHAATFASLSTVILHVDNLPVLVDERHTRPLRNVLKNRLATPPLVSVHTIHVIIQRKAVFSPYSLNMNDELQVEEATRKTEEVIRSELGPEFEARGGTLQFSWSSSGYSWGGGLDD